MDIERERSFSNVFNGVKTAWVTAKTEFLSLYLHNNLL